MSGIIYYNNKNASIFPFKYKKEIYWITCCHNEVFVDNEYLIKYNGIEYKCKLLEVSYWCDMAIFKVDDFNEKINQLNIIKSYKKIKESELYFVNIEGKEIDNKGKLVEYCATKHIINDTRYCVLGYECIFEINALPGMSGMPVVNERDQLIGYVKGGVEGSSLLVPGYFIPLVLDYMSIDLNKKISFINFNNIYKRDFDVVSINKCIINEDNDIYCKELKTNLNVFLYISSILDKRKEVLLEVKIDNEKNNIEVSLDNLNDYLRYKFNPYERIKNSYQDLVVKNKHKLLNRNLII